MEPQVEPGLLRSGMAGNALSDFSVLVGEFEVEPAQTTLLRLKRDHKLSRGQLAALFGVSVHTVRRWETGQRHPTGAARRLIWIMARFLEGKLPETLDGMLTWGLAGRTIGFESETER